MQKINSLPIMKANKEVIGELALISLPELTGHKRRMILENHGNEALVARGNTAVLMTDIASQIGLVGKHMKNKEMRPVVFALDECESRDQIAVGYCDWVVVTYSRFLCSGQALQQ